MVTFDAGQGPMVLLTNSHKSADLMPVSAIAEASARPGLTTPIKWPSEPLLGLKSTFIPMSGIAQLGTQNNELPGALRRDAASGTMELVSIRKGAFLRLSDLSTSTTSPTSSTGRRPGSRRSPDAADRRGLSRPGLEGRSVKALRATVAVWCCRRRQPRGSIRGRLVALSVGSHGAEKSVAYRAALLGTPPNPAER